MPTPAGARASGAEVLHSASAQTCCAVVGSRVLLSGSVQTFGTDARQVPDWRRAVCPEVCPDARQGARTVQTLRADSACARLGYFVESYCRSARSVMTGDCQRDRVRVHRVRCVGSRLIHRRRLSREVDPCPASPMHRCAEICRVRCRARGGRARYYRTWEQQRTGPRNSESKRTSAGTRCCCSR